MDDTIITKQTGLDNTHGSQLQVQMRPAKTKEIMGYAIFPTSSPCLSAVVLQTWQFIPISIGIFIASSLAGKRNRSQQFSLSSSKQCQCCTKSHCIDMAYMHGSQLQVQMRPAKTMEIMGNTGGTGGQTPVCQGVMQASDSRSGTGAGTVGAVSNKFHQLCVKLVSEFFPLVTCDNLWQAHVHKQLQKNTYLQYCTYMNGVRHCNGSECLLSSGVTQLQHIFPLQLPSVICCAICLH